MLSNGDWVKWCEPLDADYSYGTILDIKGKFVTIISSGYHAGSVVSVHLSCVEKIKGGGNGYGGSKKYSE